MVLPKISLYPWQCDVLEEYFPESHAIHDWLSENFDVQIQDGPDIQNIQAKIYADLRDAEMQRMNTHYKLAQGRGKTWLGSQIERERERVQRGYRVEEVQEIPSIRGRGYRPNQTWIDEARHTSEDDSRSVYGEDREESNPALREWLQRRSVCFRASSCSIPRTVRHIPSHPSRWFV